MPVPWASPSTVLPAGEVSSKSKYPDALPKRQNLYLKVALLAGQVERDGLVCISGTCAGTVLQEEGDEVRPTVQGSDVQWGGAIPVGRIHTQPTGGNLCQLLVSVEDGNGNVINV